MSLFKGTRYTHTQAYVRDHDAVMLDIRKAAVFNLRNATYYTFIEGDTIDGIAYKQYNNAALWWAILDANPKFQSEIEIVPGDVLVIPPYDEVVKWL
jgi:nucleoid-associated protein YgaU